MTTESLTSKTTKGIAWNTIDKVGNYGVGFIVGIVLARLLSPEDYGLIGIIMIFVSFFNVILDSGLSTALIRRKEVNDDDYSTVFYINLILSIALTALLFFGAPWISELFERMELVPYLRVMSFSLMISAFTLTQRVRLKRKIDFKTQTKISITSHVISGILGIALAFAGFGVWALVVQDMSDRMISAVMLWLYNKWVPGWVFSVKSFEELFGFSWKLLVASIISAIWNRLYQAVIGKVYSPVMLGYYTRGRQYIDLCSASIGDVVLNVTLPAMSSIQEDDTRLVAAYRKIIKMTMLVTFVITLGVASCAKSLILVMIGEKWLPSVPMMQIISLSMMLYPLQSININMLTVQGRSDIQLVLQIIKTILAIGPILLGVFIGFYWMLWGSVANAYIAFFLNSYYAGKKLGYTGIMQIKDIAPSFLIASAMAIIVYVIGLIKISPFILLPIQVMVGAGVVFGLCELTGLDEYQQVKVIIFDYLRKIRRK